MGFDSYFSNVPLKDGHKRLEQGEKCLAQSEPTPGNMIFPEKSELALGLMDGRQRAWHKPVITDGLIFAVGREAKLHKGKILYPKSTWFPPAQESPCFRPSSWTK